MTASKRLFFSMREDVAMRLFGEVRSVYDDIADDFSETRSSVWSETECFRDYVKPGFCVLDIGCGNGRAYQIFSGTAIEYDGLDVSVKLIAIAKRRVLDVLANFRVGSMLDLPYEDASFDVVVAVAVLHHLPSRRLRRQAMSEAFRVLKPGGTLLMTNWDLWHLKRLEWLLRNIAAKIIGRSELDWNDVMIPWKRRQKKPLMRYYHGFTLGELRRLAGAVGFSIIENKRSGNVRRSGDVNLVTICRKPVGRESQAVMTGLE